jgi:hypothetical protein
MRRVVARNLFSLLVGGVLAASFAASFAASCAGLAFSRRSSDAAARRMRLTMSVVETPSVRLIILNLPARLGASYASVPSGSRHGSSPCTMKSTPCFE